MLTAPLPFSSASLDTLGRDGPPALLRAVFDATAAARAVAPPRPGIEFLHGWAAFHLDPDLAGPPRPNPPDDADPAADYRIDADDAAVFEVLERAAALAPGDPLFAEARRAAADWRRR